MTFQKATVVKCWDVAGYTKTASGFQTNQLLKFKGHRSKKQSLIKTGLICKLHIPLFLLQKAVGK